MTQQLVEAPLTEFLHRKAALRGVPLNGTFELTPCCNMACKMCYVRMTRQEQERIAPLRTAAEWLDLGRTARAQGMLYLLLTGGEPFLRADVREILSGLHGLGLVISVNTNGTLIDEAAVDWLRRTPPARVNLTLYGASDETYARLCGNPRGYTQAVRAIRLLRAAGIAVKLNCSVTPYNAGDLAAIFAFARQEGLAVQATSYMFPPVRRDEGMAGRNDRFSPEEAAYYSACIGCQQNGEAAFLRYLEAGGCPVPPEPGEDCPPVAEGEGVRCRAGRCSFWVTWEGRLLPCGMFPTREAPNVFRSDFADAWQRLRRETAAIRLPVACAACAWREQCRPCAAMVYTESGNFHTVPAYRCRMTKSYRAGCERLASELRRGEGSAS